MSELNPLILINNLRKTDNYIESIFTQGSCYQFHLFIKSIWTDAIPVINATNDHVGSLINGIVYDIQGVANWSFRGMDDEDIELAETWSFANNNMLQVGECEFCEEPKVL